MHEIDLMSIGSYTELPGGNIALPQGYSSLLTPIIQQVQCSNVPMLQCSNVPMFKCSIFQMFKCSNSSLLTPIIQQIPDELILKQKPIQEIQWRWREEKDANEGYESDGSDCSVRTVKSVEGADGGGVVNDNYPDIKGLSHNSLPASCISSRRGSKEALNVDPCKRRCGKPNVKLETEAGEIFYADHVICTMPLGIL